MKTEFVTASSILALTIVARAANFHVAIGGSAVSGHTDDYIVKPVCEFEKYLIRLPAEFDENV